MSHISLSSDFAYPISHTPEHPFIGSQSLQLQLTHSLPSCEYVPLGQDLQFRSCPLQTDEEKLESVNSQISLASLTKHLKHFSPLK